MDLKFVWCEGKIAFANNYGKTSHSQILRQMIENGVVPLKSKEQYNYFGGDYSTDDIHGPAFDHIKVIWQQGTHPTTEEMRYLIQQELGRTSRLAMYEKKVAATSEDTEPLGDQVGFLHDPHKELYPNLFRGEKKIPEEVKQALKDHVLDPLSKEFVKPDNFIYFTIYGSGISYNWDESGDLDLQLWVDSDKYTRTTNDPMDLDDLIAAIRRIVGPINFPSFIDLGLTETGDTKEQATGTMLIQYYPKPGKGSKEENLASQPYACYDLETDEWLQPPKPIKPRFYGDNFILLMPKAKDIALQAESLLGEYQRNVLNFSFWFALYSRYRKKEYKEQFTEAMQNATQEKEGIRVLFDGVFGGRAEAYAPGGQGIYDERDMIQKLLEVWGTFQDLKHYARAPLPWEEQEMPQPKSKWHLAGVSDDIIMEGGGTFNEDLTPVMREDGYWVSVADHGTVVPVDEFDDVALARYAGHVNLRSDEYIGAWVDEGLVHLDVTRWFEDLNEALEFGAKNGQLAIWDIAGNREIRVLAPAKTGMADRSGVPEVDALIEEFLQTPMGDWTTDELPIEALRDPENSHGNCQMVTEQFVAFARERGFKAYATDTDLDEMGYKPTGQGGEIGFNDNDEMQYGFYPEHTVASIYLDESRFPIIVDFTATQYGYTDHPKVSKIAALQGLPENAIGPHPELQDIAHQYAQSAGLQYNPPQDYAYVDPHKAQRIAELYDKMEHSPDDPQVAASYKAMINETKAQYDHLKANGYNFEFYPSDRDPYPSGPRAAIEDLRNNKHMYVYPTAAGFGQDEPDLSHPLIAPSGEMWNGQPVTHNDIFRAVHDAFGHGKEGVGFRADGEENAWRQHSAMYSDLARPAMTAETRGQNSWVNFGPHGQHNQKANQNDTIYADQKATILPPWAVYEKQSKWKLALHGGQNLDPDVVEELQRQVDYFARILDVKINHDPEMPNWGGWYISMKTFDGIDFDHQPNVYVPSLVTVNDYWAVLHELGHAAYTHSFGGTQEDPEEENWAWKWAKENSLLPVTHEVQDMIDAALRTYLGVKPEDADLPKLQDTMDRAIDDFRSQTPRRNLPLTPHYEASFQKTAVWSDIMEKAQRLRDNGQVQIQVNDPNHVVGQVQGDHGTYETEIWRDDPNSGTITLWNCDCPWSQYSWGRTRQWKKYEGRPCAHTLALYWTALAQPPAPEGQQTIPGTTPQQVSLPNALQQTVPSTAPAPQKPSESQPNPPAPALKPDGQLSLDWPGALSHISKWRKEGMFMNGDIVRVNQKVEGYDDRGTYYVVPRNMVGEVIWSDDDETIAIFSIESSYLGPHNVKVTAPTELFTLLPRSRGTAPRRRQ